MSSLRSLYLKMMKMMKMTQEILLIFSLISSSYQRRASMIVTSARTLSLNKLRLNKLRLNKLRLNKLRLNELSLIALHLNRSR